MPKPPWPAHQAKFGSSGSGPSTSTRSGAKVRSPAQEVDTVRASRVVVSCTRSSAVAMSSISGRGSHGSDGVSSAGEARKCPGSGLR